MKSTFDYPFFFFLIWILKNSFISRTASSIKLKLVCICWKSVFNTFLFLAFLFQTLVQLQPPRQRRLQTDSIFEYFFGTLREVFVPYRIEYKREDLNILSVDPVGSMGSKHKRPKLKMSPVDLGKSDI